ncbi:MAG TPA: AsmA family protein, partial [Steroidobacteraceae bacterium]|nr:AsmA family protein [Steroidobacteraceae bacterium]
MSKPLKVTLIVLVPLVLLAALVAFLLSRVDTRSQFETMASEALGLEVVVKGSASIGLFPTPHVALKDVTLQNKEARIASVSEADVGVEFWPLLRKDVHITRLVLQTVNIEVERDHKGQLNFLKPSQIEPTVPTTSLARLSLVKANFTYTNHASGKQ